MNREVRNAKIESTMLGVEDHGIFTCMIHLNFGGSGQGFGGYGFDEWSAVCDRRVGTAYGIEFISAVLRVVGVDKWEDLKGKHVRADHDYGKVYRIGHIIEEKWFDPADLYVARKLKLEEIR